MTLNHVFGHQSYSRGDHRVFDQLDGLTELVGHLELTDLDALKRSSDVSFVKTHSLLTDDGPAIYLLRHGMDCLVSYAHYQMKFRRKTPPWIRRLKQVVGRDPFKVILEEIIRGKGPHGSWSEHFETWTNRPNAKTAVLKYEDLIQDPVSSVSRALDCVGHPVSLHSFDDLPSFAELHDKWPSFFRKGKTGTGRQEMPPRLQEVFWKHHGDAMTKAGYARETPK